MLKRITIIASLALLFAALPSYSKNPVDQKEQRSADDRTVKVTVANEMISVDPDPVKMKKSSNKITWELATPGFSFPANGIVIKRAGGEYGECRNKSKTEFVCKKLKHADKKEYKYDVNLVNDSTGKPLSRDPIIIND
jgi:hypothetical protein